MLNTNYKKSLLLNVFKAVSSSTFFSSTVLTLLAMGSEGAEIAKAAAAFALAIVIFDIPSGFFADKIGHRRTVLLATIFELASTICFIFSPSFFGMLVAAYFLRGTSASLDSGALRLLILDQAFNENPNKAEATARSTRHIQYLNRFGSLFGVAIASFSNALPLVPWIFMAICALGQFFTLLSLPTKTSVEHEGNFQTIFDRQEMKGILHIFTTPVAVILGLLAVLDGTQEGLDGLAFFPYMSLAFGGAEWLWLIPIIVVPVRLVSTYLTQFLPRHLWNVAAILATMGLALPYFIFSSTTNFALALIGQAIASVLFSLNNVWADVWQLEVAEASGKLRATFLSIISTIKNFIHVIVAYLVGVFDLLSPPYSDLYSIQTFFYLMIPSVCIGIYLIKCRVLRR